VLNVNRPNWNDVEPCCINAVSALKCGAILFDTNQGQLVLSISNIGLRLQTRPNFDATNANTNFDYGIVINPPVREYLRLDETDTDINLSSGSHQVLIQKSPFAFQWFENGVLIQQTPNDGHFVRQYRLPPLAKTQQGWLFNIDLGAEEPVYGLGEKWSSLNKRGQFVRSFNHDALGVNAELSYKNTPFAWSPNGWGLFINTPAPVSHSVGYAVWSQRAYTVVVEDDELDLFLFTADNGPQLLDIYTNLTGKAPIPPLWSLGVI
jgi:alpha-D-xyloside xylohydrolase